MPIIRDFIINVIQEHASNNVPNTAPGETVALRVEDVNCCHNTGTDLPPTKFSNGIVWLTNYQIIWKSTERESLVSHCVHLEFFLRLASREECGLI